jgi:hypothetical protein
MNARRLLILLAVLGFVFAPLAAALPPGRAAEAAALPSGRTAEAAAGAPQAPTATKPEVKADLTQTVKVDAPAKTAAAPAAKPAALPSGSAGAAPAKKAPVKRTEPIIPAFQTPREKTAVIVFYVWLWLSIGVLIYFLRWWVQEADRVFRAKFYEPVESPRKDNPLPPYLGE